MRYQVPQFIEIEDKIFGPLTFKQFIYVAGGVGICVLLFTFFPRFLAFILSAPVVAFSGALAFYKFNNKPFIDLVESFFKYSLTNKLYIWKKEAQKSTASQPNQVNAKGVEQVYIPKLSDSKLKDLTWSLDVKDNTNPVTEDKE